MTVPGHAPSASACYTNRVAIVLALLSATIYGVSDYLGGRTSRRFSPIAVTCVAEVALAPIIAVIVLAVEDGSPSARAFWWGVVAGLAGSLGVIGLYAALSRGNMTVVAPVTGIVAAGFPVVVGLSLGERPELLGLLGIVLAVGAVALIGGAVGATYHDVTVGTIALAVLVGASFGLLFIGYDQAGDDAGLWPLLTARAGGAPLLLAAYVVGRRRGQVERLSFAVVRPSVAIGALIGLANALFLLSTREGLLSIVAVLVSLYPASTIVLAMVFDRERAARPQLAGMSLAVVAVALITLGS